jgi:hypothetical protein
MVKNTSKSFFFLCNVGRVSPSLLANPQSSISRDVPVQATLPQRTNSPSSESRLSLRSRQNSVPVIVPPRPNPASLLPAISSFFNVPVPIIQEPLPQNNRSISNCFLNRFEYQLSSTQLLSSDTSICEKPPAPILEVGSSDEGMVNS